MEIKESVIIRKIFVSEMRQNDILQTVRKPLWGNAGDFPHPRYPAVRNDLIMKVFITGVAGTGKSTISKELNKRGVFSIDFSDHPEFRYWRDRTTKQKVEYAAANDKTWFDRNESVCDFDKLKEVLDQHENIVITGVATGTEHLSLFDKVLLLQSSPETIIHRLETRDRVFGKTKAEQDHVLEWQKEFDPELLAHGAISINTEESLSVVVDKVLKWKAR